MRSIPLGRGYVALVDDEGYDRSYLRRHSVLSRASSRQTGRQELERSDFVPELGSVIDLHRVTCDSPFSGLRPRVYKPWRFGRNLQTKAVDRSPFFTIRIQTCTTPC